MSEHYGTLEIVVLSINYQVLGDGTITYKLITSPEIADSLYIHSEYFHALPYIDSGSVVHIHPSGIWEPKGCIDILPKDRVLINELTACPICNQPIIQNHMHKYCINDSCIAKLHVGIHRFLLYSGIELNRHEKQAIDMLIGNKIKYPADLFNLSESDFSYIDFDLKFHPKDLINTLRNIKMSISTFLFSINVPGISVMNNSFLDTRLIDSTFTNIRDFVQWIHSIQIEASSTHSEVSSHPYMSTELFDVMYHYFSVQSNYMNAIALDNFHVFR
jgi:hypothetical protein